MSEENPNQSKSDRGWGVLVLITIVWFGVISWYLSLPFEKNGEKLYWFAKIAAQDPSNFGDFLSGAFAPVAFVWLAYSVWIQQQELRLTRDVMKDQEAALKSSSESNSALAKETKIQNDIEINKNNYEHMISMIENFYEICKIQMQIHVPTEQGLNYSIPVGYNGNNGTDRFAYSCFHIARAINQIKDYAVGQHANFSSNGGEHAFLGFCRIVEEMELISNSSQFSKALYRAHGLDQVETALKALRKELSNEK